MRFRKFLSYLLVSSLVNSGLAWSMPGNDPALNALEERTQAGWEKFKFLQKRILQVTGAKRTGKESEDMAEISGPFMERYVITQEMARTILSIDEVGDITRENDKGTSPVKRLDNVFFKTDGRHFNPEKPMLSPALENAAYWFYHIMFGEGATPSSLITINNVLIKRAPLSLSQKFPDLFKKYNWERERRKGFSSFFQKALEEGISNDTLNQFKEGFEPNYESFIIQASLGVGLEGLDDFVDSTYGNPQKEGFQIPKPERFNELKVKNVSIHFLTSIILNLSDAKGDNFRVENGSIIGIDNDRFFAPDIFRQCSHQEDEHAHYALCNSVNHKVGTRSIFYCWPEILNMTLDNEIRSLISSTNPVTFISQWLYQLQLYDKEFIKLRQAKILGEEWFKVPTLEEVTDSTKYMIRLNLVSLSAVFPLFLPQRAIGPMIQRLEGLVSLLKFSNNINHKSVLETIQPHVAEYYNKLMEREPNISCNEAIGRVYEKYGSSYENLFLPQYLTDNFMKDIKNPSTGVNLSAIVETIIKNVALQKYLVKDQVSIVNAIGRLSTVINISKERFDEAWLSPGLHLTLASQGLSPDGLRLLLSLGHLIDQQDDQNQGLVHKAVLSSKVDLDNATALLDFLHNRRCDFDLKSTARNESAGTPLTQAMRLPEDCALLMFSKLIELGAGLETNYMVAKSFIDKYDTHLTHNDYLKDKLATLLRRDPKLHWQLSLDKLLPLVAEIQEEGEVIKTSNSKERVLSLELEKSMLDSKGNLVNQTRYGRRNVNSINTPDGMYGIYFKTFPELPGVEEQVGRLTRNLLGYGAPHTELVRYKDIPVLLSQAILGENLQDVLNKKPQILNQLDHKNLSGMILLSILVNPEDGKPDNFILEPVPGYQDKYRLICVDNDHAFVQAVAKEQNTSWFGTHSIMQVRSVLYCLDQMHTHVHQDIKDLFIKLDPAEVLRRWLSELRTVSYMYTDLFNAGEMSNFFQKHESFLCMPFKENVVPELYQKFIRLKDALEENEKITHLELLMKLEPLLGRRYIQVLGKPITVKERFDEVDGVFYSKAIAGTYGTVTNSSQMLTSMNIPNKATVIDDLRRGKGYGVEQAVKQLKEAEDKQTTNALNLKNLQLGNLGELGNSKNAQLLEEALEKIDFSKIGSNNEQALIKSIKTLPNKLEHIRKLHLKGSKVIVNGDLTHKVLGIGNITILNISGCSNLTQDIFARISIECPGLKQLLSPGIGNSTNPVREIVYKESQGLLAGKIEKDIYYPYLEILNINDSPELSRERIIAPKLKTLEANNCSKFNFIESNLLKVLTLEKVGLANNHLITEKEIIDLLINRPKIKYYNLEGCANIPNPNKYKDRKTLYKNIFDELKINVNDKEVKLESKNITIIQVVVISSLTNLTTLDLRSNQIGSEEAKTLSILTNLTSLNLYNNKIVDTGAKALSLLTNLTTLDLSSNQIGDEGAKALSLLTNLTNLDLSLNKIGNKGAKALSLLPNLTTLNLWKNQIGNEGAKALTSLTNLTTLNLSGSTFNKGNITYEVAKALSILTNLTTLDLSYNQIGDEGAKALSLLTNLTTLNLWDNQIGDEGAKALSLLTNLAILELRYNQIGVEGAKSLSSLTNLTTLELRYNQIGDEGAKSLTSLTNLIDLPLDNNKIGDEMIKKLYEIVKQNKAKAPPKEEKQTSEDHKNPKATQNKKAIQDVWHITHHNITIILKTLENPTFEINEDEFNKIPISKESAIKLIQNNIKFQNVGGRQFQTLLSYYSQANSELNRIIIKVEPKMMRGRKVTSSTLYQAQSLLPRIGISITIEPKLKDELLSTINQMKDVLDLLNHYLENNPAVCKSIVLHTLKHFNQLVYQEDGSIDTNFLNLYSKIVGKPLFIWQEDPKMQEPRFTILYSNSYDNELLKGTNFLYQESDNSLTPLVASSP